MRTRTKLALWGAVAAWLFGGSAGTAVSEECPSYDDAPHKSGCADVSVSPARVRPGETITVSIQLNCGGAQVSCSYAQAEGILVDGTPTTGTGGPAPMYHGTAVYPAAGPQVSISGNGGHTVVFRIREDAPDACVDTTGFGASGPWVSVGSGSSWSTPVHFAIDRKAGRDVSLAMKATPQPAKPRPEADEVRPGEKLDYEVTATADSTATDLRIWVPLPSGTFLVPNTISDGGVVRSNELQWRFSGVASKKVTFQVQLRDAKSLRRIDEVVANGRTRAVFGKKSSASDSVRVQTKIGKPTQVRGTVYDAVLDFPRKTHVDENDPIGGVKVELLDGTGEVVSSDTADGGGRYEVEAGDTGTFTLRVSAKADKYSTGSNQVLAGFLEVVQERTVEIASLTAPPKQVDVRVPRGILNHAARSLHALNNLRHSFAGVVPLDYRMDTAAIEGAIEELVEAKEEYFVSTEAHAPNGWDALVRLSACLSTVDDRYVDMAVAIDDLAKIIPVAILIQLMQKHGDGFSERYGGVKTDKPPVTSRGRLVEAAKIATLAYGVGNLLPPLLDRLGVPPEQKGVVIELTYKLVRFGANLFVPGMNTGDIVFEVILQSARVAIFAAGMTSARIFLQAEIDHAASKFASRQVAGTHSDALAALALFDDRVRDRSRQLHKLTLDALASISQIVRGADGIVIKLRMAVGFGAGQNVIKKGLEAGLKPFGNALGFLKKKLFVPYFVTAAACAGGTVALTPVDVHSEVTYAFAGFPAGARPIDLRADVVGDWLVSWKNKATSFFEGDPGAKPAPTPTTLPEFTAVLDRLDAIAAQIRAKDPEAYVASLDAAGAELDAFGTFLVPLVDRCVDAPWEGEPRYGLCVMHATGAVDALARALFLTDAWSIEPTKSLAADALREIAAARKAVNDAGLAVEAVLPLLGDLETGPSVFVSVEDPVSTAPPDTEIQVRLAVTNHGDVALAGGTLDFEPAAGLTVVSPVGPQAFGTIAPGASVVLEWRVRTTASAPAFAAFSAYATSPDVPVSGLFESFVVQAPE